jgi:hypothetical protein
MKLRPWIKHGDATATLTRVEQTQRLEARDGSRTNRRTFCRDGGAESAFAACGVNPYKPRAAFPSGCGAP